MKPSTLIWIASFAAAACSGSSSDRPGSIEERRVRIDNERGPKAEARDRDQLYGPGAPEPASDFDRDGDGIADADETGPETTENPLNESRDPNALTPMDQSSESSDIEITQAIRKKVVGDDQLSFNAKNVKIITVGGKVTLRGPVEDARESATIERSARDVPGVTRVDNQLEVK